ncbi:hypothetical protein IWQ62_003966 [Dispira parvispora]|uniref:Uncharacterized protein n=1 Tax=Dispira parvispora TaxID=1520584 RepID=A0A9W8ATA5_9FUNG|nr:hypothetical protein IWQ62_003966 [Dispira parvispora]
MYEPSVLTQDVIHHAKLGVRTFTGELSGRPFQSWLVDAEKAIARAVPNAPDDTKYLVIQQLIDPVIVDQLHEASVPNWNSLVKVLTRRYPLYKWQRSYSDKLSNLTLFDGLKLEQAISKANTAIEYLAAAPPHIWDEEPLTITDFQPRMEEIRILVQADLVRTQGEVMARPLTNQTSPQLTKEHTAESTLPQAQKAGKEGSNVGQVTKSTGKKKSRVQKLREKLETSERKYEELEKKLTGKE